MLIRRRGRRASLLGTFVLVGGLIVGSTSPAAASGPNMVAQWDQIAENVVVPAGTSQIDGLIYMAYAQLAVYDAVVAIDGGYEPYGSALSAPSGASAEAAVVQAAYEVLTHYFPTTSVDLAAARSASLATISDGAADGIAVGHTAAQQIFAMRAGDGLQAGPPYGATSSFTHRDPGPGTWRLTPPAYAAPQIPWVGDMTPFVSASPDRFRPAPPPSLSSATWVADFNEIKLMGQNTSAVRTAEQTAVARFYTANVPRQWNTLVRDIAADKGLGLLETARLAAMINTVGADAGIAVINAKYHFQFWRPVTAIDPTSVQAGDGFGPTPGYDDGNPLTVEQTGWRPLLTTPNHPEYPAAHGTVTSSIAEVLTQFLGTSRIDVDIRGADSATNNLNAVRHFDKANQLRAEVINARVWGGVHYRTSVEAGVDLGRSVAKYDLKHAFELVP
jgi:hypothetical protein